MCKNQPPLIQRHRGRAEVFFTGLSAVATEQASHDEPFSEHTRSGGLLRQVAGDLAVTTVYYTNLVKCLPLHEGRIRYPRRSELELCFKNYQRELGTFLPRKVVLFGKQVSEFIAAKLQLNFGSSRRDFDFPVAHRDGVQYLAAYHPSYVLVYKRRHLALYKRRIADFADA